jgi:hypothetical protein
MPKQCRHDRELISLMDYRTRLDCLNFSSPMSAAASAPMSAFS